MRGKSKVGERVVMSEVADYFLRKKTSGLFLDPILAAQLKDWLGDTKEALNILATYLADVPDDFNGIKVMATLHASGGNFIDAVKSAQTLVKLAPWRAESYDCLAYVAARAGDASLENQAKIKGEKVFAEEMRLYEEAKTYLN